MNDDIFKIDIDGIVTESTDDVMDLSIDDNYNESSDDDDQVAKNRHKAGTYFTFKGQVYEAHAARDDETRKAMGEKTREEERKEAVPLKESAENISISLAGTKDQPPEDAYNANLTKLRKSFNDALDAFEAYSKKRK